MEATDDDELTFLHIAALTANVVRYLSEQQKDSSAEDAGHAEEQKNKEIRRELAVIGIGKKSPNGI